MEQVRMFNYRATCVALLSAGATWMGDLSADR